MQDLPRFNGLPDVLPADDARRLRPVTLALGYPAIGGRAEPTAPLPRVHERHSVAQRAT